MTITGHHMVIQSLPKIALAPTPGDTIGPLKRSDQHHVFVLSVIWGETGSIYYKLTGLKEQNVPTKL